MSEARKETSGVEPEAVPAAELEVLACLWQRDRLTARQIREAVAPFRPMTHGATLTLLKRLEEKRLVRKTSQKVGKAFVYCATGRGGPAYGRIMGDLRRRIFGGSGVTMVASLFESAPPSRDELDELEQLLTELRARQTREDQ